MGRVEWLSVDLDGGSVDLSRGEPQAVSNGSRCSGIGTTGN
jgi:hypothetical protein